MSVGFVGGVDVRVVCKVGSAVVGCRTISSHRVLWVGLVRWWNVGAMCLIGRLLRLLMNCVVSLCRMVKLQFLLGLSMLSVAVSVLVSTYALRSMAIVISLRWIGRLACGLTTRDR